MKTILGKKNFYYWLQLIFITPLWVLHIGQKKKWSEFKSGLIPHKCEWEDVPYEIMDCTYDNVHYHACKHYGCNIVNPKTYLTEKGKSLPWRNEDDYDGVEPKYNDPNIKYTKL